MTRFEDNGLFAWEANASFWDDYMGDESNYFHRDLVRPGTEQFLDVHPGERVLDIACGNGNFSARLAEQGARVVAFDYSPAMIALAKKRRAGYLDRVAFYVCDAADRRAVLALGQGEPFDKAVSNMAIMDMNDIEPLFQAVFTLLRENGVFVFTAHHPCFTYPNGDYFTSCIDRGEAIEGQPVLQNYYHRSIQDVLNAAFEAGFVLDGFHEVPFPGRSTPIIMIVRLRKR